MTQVVNRGKEIYSTHDAARVCRVTPMTVIRWIKEGKIPAFKTAGGHRRILRADLVRFCKTRAIPFAPEDVETGRVLIADADPAVRDAVADAVRTVDPTLAVELAGDAFTAGRLVGELRPNLLFIDQRLVGADVLDLTSRLASGSDGIFAIRVAVLVAAPSADAERALRSRGAVACLGKPPSAAAVDRVVRSAFNLPEAASAAPTIHVVDPDARSGRALRRDLEARVPGCRVIIFESAIDALLTLPIERPDMLLVDVTDPEINAAALIRRVVLHAGEPPFPVVALAPARAEALGVAAVAAGAMAFVPKPCTVDDLLEFLPLNGRAAAARKRNARR